MHPDPPSVERLFDEAMELEPGERAAFLANRCADNTALLHRVKALLSAHELARGFLPELSQGAFPAVEETLLSESVGTTIGRYKLVEKLGEGGFGVVWAAEQCQPIRRRVALKIIKLGMDTRQVIARFEAERQALALMDHPNIAKVLDAGATDTGRPYFAMELTSGIPITTYCQQRRLEIKDRLSLFIKICHAIQHAHQKGIIHRDIKPSNIIVVLQDGAAVPKVIDFGIAKATQTGLDDQTIFTQLQQFVGTPAYMSPEQADTTRSDIDTRSDIYSLGVLLYELLTGNTPFDGKALLQSGLDEMRRIIREQEPVRPSTKLNQSRASTVECGSPKTQISISKSEIDKDLDWIVMKCLEKDRGRRYETANGLAMDLQRHLNNEPVIARPPSGTYRLQKTFRRNKLIFISAALVVAALIAGLGLATTAWRQSARRAETITRNLYFAEMNSAAQAAVEPGGISRVDEITTKWRPQTGDVDRRGWEWYYLRSLLHSDLFTFVGHTNGVLSVAWSHDGKYLASAGSDNTIRIWNAVTHANIQTLRGHSNRVMSVAWNADGTRLATASGDKTIKLWDTVNGSNTLTLTGHTDAVHSVAWSPDGKHLASGGGKADSTVRIWNALTGQATFTFAGHTMWINAVAWSPDSKCVASAGADNSIKIWNLENPKATRTLRGHPRPYSVNTVAWSPDGKHLASGANDFMLLIWDVTAGTNIFPPLSGHTMHVVSIAWNSDGTRLASTSRDTTVKIWDAKTGTNITTLRGHTGDVNSVAWSPDGTQLISGSSDRTVKLWKADSEEILTLRGHNDEVMSVAWHPDGSRLVSASRDNSLKIWDADKGGNILTLTGHTGDVFSVAWSRDGKRIASGSFDARVKVWDAEIGTNLLTLTETGGIYSVAWSPDSKSLAVSSWYETNFNIWNLKSTSDIRCLNGHSDSIFSVSWSPDGTFLASGSWDKTVKIWNANSGEVVRTFSGHTDTVRSVAWSPNGKRLASASLDFSLKIWESNTGTNISLRGHTGAAVVVAWSPDGQRLASGSYDNTVKVWDAATGQETLTLRGHATPIQSVAWSPDGTRIASASRDHTIKIWDARKAYALEHHQSIHR